ncbi:FtsX-like permease family protein [Janibacter sp. GS2]|uniref:FtsX-like permease family protein n=1 Tax=Janibacter sp. GS2 TaxID=3442646 RepID=UPI003EBE5B7E
MSLTWTEASRLAAKGGPDDRLRRWLIGGCAALGAMLFAAAASIPSFWADGVNRDAKAYSVLGELLADPGLAGGVVVALVLMAVPVAHLTVQAVRVGAPGRDTRLAAMRSAGATPADVGKVIRAEALVCSAVGTAMGVVVFYGLLAIAPRVFRVGYSDAVAGTGTESGSVPVLEVGVWPNPLVLVLAAALGPLLAVLLLPLAARRVQATVVGQARSERQQGTFVSLALVVFMILSIVSVIVLLMGRPEGERWYTPVLDGLATLLPITACGLCVTVLTVWAPGVAARIGRSLSGRGGATGLLAGRLMLARPRLASRTAVSLVLVALVGAVSIITEGVLRSELMSGVRGYGYDEVEAGGQLPSEVLFYLVPVLVVQTLTVVAAVLGAVGLFVAVTEQTSLRAPQLTRQVAAGVPRSLLRRALVVEAAAPVAAMTTIALFAGAGVPVLALVVGGQTDLLNGTHWERFPILWGALVGGAALAAHVGGRNLADGGDVRRIRDR